MGTPVQGASGKSTWSHASPRSGLHQLRGFPSNFIFDIDGHRMILNVYVDDLTLSGPSHLHKTFWDRFSKMIKIEDPSWGFGWAGGGWIHYQGVGGLALATDTGKHLSKLALGAAPAPDNHL